ncbi:hypothetical protein SpiGrapes_1819 [Sphaerochaeta pleomorpha str. Grapes]|uniref:Glycosyl-4,4'-diaponeurosporenoate acyltransferase n=1 Tax=Sphaerochaeta pleomorpha (strain ATCC BAA-1885 / DSM 22778 / Grapes) TaxID=158190 RepID=G8QY49_SPHPG|nr:hypothetical protein [Sphaerochaeta pleomorpha]AEV29614.1 hypothetical protein SpiGrapes_1819 [Sphaerochaeta pleomorpha str. Grapes]
MDINPGKFAAALVMSQIVASVVVDHLCKESLQVLRKKLKSYQWEQNGQIYQQYLHIKSWKSRVPEIGDQFCKAHLQESSQEYLSLFVLETVRAELCHEIALFLAIPLILNADLAYANWAILYCLLANIPFIMIQRYNRPRLEKIIARKVRENTEPAISQNSSPILIR